MMKEADNSVIDPFAAALEVSDVKGRSPWQDAWHRLLKNRAAVYSAFIMAAMFVMVVFGPMLISWEPDYTDWDHTSSPPSLSSGHWFGTDAVSGYPRAYTHRWQDFPDGRPGSNPGQFVDRC